LWNTGVDAGVSIGGVGLALVASRYSLEAVFWVLPLFAAGSLVVLAAGWIRSPLPTVQTRTTRRAFISDRGMAATGTESQDRRRSKSLM
jgi:hypothetical protein